MAQAPTETKAPDPYRDYLRWPSMMDRSHYEAYYQTMHWETIRSQALTYYDRECAVCGNDYKQHRTPLNVHHVHYWYAGQHVFYHESISRDLAVLCARHHPKGAFSRESIYRWRSSYRWQKRLGLLLRILWKTVKWMAKQIGKGILSIITQQD